MAQESRQRGFLGTLGALCIGIIGWTFVTIDEFIFDEYIFGNITVWCNNTFMGIVSPLVGEGSPFWIGRTVGALAAFFIILPIAAVICRLYLFGYDLLKIDWLGAESFKDLIDDEPRGWLGRLRKRIVNLGELPALIMLSIWKDAFVTTAFLRKREHRYGGLTERDWKIFRASLLISVGYWSLRWSFITLLVQWVFPYFPPEVQQFLLWLWELNLKILEWVGQVSAESWHVLTDFIHRLLPFVF